MFSDWFIKALKVCLVLFCFSTCRRVTAMLSDNFQPPDSTNPSPSPHSLTCLGCVGGVTHMSLHNLFISVSTSSRLINVAVCDRISFFSRSVKKSHGFCILNSVCPVVSQQYCAAPWHALCKKHCCKDSFILT